MTTPLCPRSRRCYKCQKLFEAGCAYLSFLVKDERSDYCLFCAPEKKGTFWRGSIPVKESKSKRFDERAQGHFEQAIAAGEQEKAHLLALYLERLGQLVRVSKKGILPLLFESPKRGTLFEVQLSGTKLNSLRELVETIDCQLHG